MSVVECMSLKLCAFHVHHHVPSLLSGSLFLACIGYRLPPSLLICSGVASVRCIANRANVEVVLQPGVGSRIHGIVWRENYIRVRFTTRFFILFTNTYYRKTMPSHVHDILQIAYYASWDNHHIVVDHKSYCKRLSAHNRNVKSIRVFPNTSFCLMNHWSVLPTQTVLVRLDRWR